MADDKKVYCPYCGEKQEPQPVQYRLEEEAASFTPENSDVGGFKSEEGGNVLVLEEAHVEDD